jgi:hypothetical protein
MSTRHETTEEKLAWLRELGDAAAHAGSEKAVARQHERGKLPARSSSSTASSATVRASSACATSVRGATRS